MPVRWHDARRDQRVEVRASARPDPRRRSIADPPAARMLMSPIVAGAVLAVAAVFLGLPSALLLASGFILGTVGVALIIARPHEEPDPTSSRTSHASDVTPVGPGDLRSDLTEP